jgi:hypothetical protein
LLTVDRPGARRLSQAHTRVVAGAGQARLAGLWPLLTATALAAALRFATLGIQSYWLDEMYTARLARMGFVPMLRTMSTTERTPPLYYLLAWIWAHLLGTGEAQLRSLSALAGTAAVPVAYAVATRAVSKRAGVVAAVLVAVNPLLVWYSQEARAYALLALLGGLSVACFLRALDEPRGGLYARWAVVSLLAVACHYYAIFLVAAEGIWLAARATRRRPALTAFGATLAADALLAPLALHQAHAHTTSATDAAGPTPSLLDQRMLKVPKEFVVGFNSPHETAVTLACGGLVALSLLLLLGARREPGGRRALTVASVAAAGVVGPMLFYQLLRNPDYLRTNYLLGALVPCGVVVAAGFAVRRIGVAGAALLAALSVLVVASVASEPRFQRQNWRAAAEALGPAHGARAVYVAPGGNLERIGIVDAIGYYAPRLRFFPPGGAVVGEVDVVAMAGGGLQPTALRRRLRELGFVGSGSAHGTRYDVLRFRAASPVRLTRRALAALPSGTASRGRDILLQTAK